MNESANKQPLLLENTINKVSWITLNRPQQRNPLSSQMLSALTNALSTASQDSKVNAIVIAAIGPVYCAGHDLREMSHHKDEALEVQQERIRGILEQCSAMMLSIVRSPKAVIACVQGMATAAGCQLVSACDLAIAAETATFCAPGVNIGGFCTTPLVGIGRNIHRKHAMAMALTGEAISAHEAARIGLINEVVSPDRLIHRTGEQANLIASKSTQGIGQGKADFYKQIDMPLEEAFNYASEAMVRAMTTEDALEGTKAFLEKRAPRWHDS